MSILKISKLSFLVSAVVLTFSCGSGSKSSDSPAPKGKLESAFETASTLSGVPVRMMMAVGYLESRLNSERQSALYLNPNGPASDSTLSVGSSAFGIDLNGRTGSMGATTELESQILSYGQFLKDFGLDESLPKNAMTAEEKIRWILELATVHRGQDIRFRKLWSIFAVEMMNIMNQGFIYQDIASGEKLVFEKEGTPMTPEQLPRNYQQDLNLTSIPSEIRVARFFELSRTPDETAVANSPTRIEVVHCPFSYSACLKMQTGEGQERAQLGAHYLVSNDQTDRFGILQVAKHNESISLMNTSGVVETVKDRIVVMLTGSSGSFVSGNRKTANPLWLTDEQLNLLGLMIPQICAKLQFSYGVNEGTCRTPGSGPNQLTFRSTPDQNYRWGDIPDFEETIFWPYFNSTEGVFGSTSMTLEGGERLVAAASTYSMKVQFQPSARRITLERLVRCSQDNRVVWESIENKPIKGISQKSFELSWDDAGPNGNGEQFFRTKVSGENNKFLGWATQRVQITGYDRKNLALTQSKECY
ncbi:MAG: hypothetical protein NT027_10145 [Proteobacteria bacterium]|nr:hypothetical protein [Pseudomonadota bacterium]